MIYLKLFENFCGVGVDQNLSNMIDATLLPITDIGYKYNVEIYDIGSGFLKGLKDHNDQKRLEINIYIDGENSFTEEPNIINGTEIKESVLVILEFLKRKIGNDPAIYLWDSNDYKFISMADSDTHGIKDLSDLRSEYAETDLIKIVVLLDS